MIHRSAGVPTAVSRSGDMDRIPQPSLAISVATRLPKSGSTSRTNAKCPSYRDYLSFMVITKQSTLRAYTKTPIW